MLFSTTCLLFLSNYTRALFLVTLSYITVNFTIVMKPFFIEPDIARAKTITTDFYTNPQYFEASKEKIFGKSWQFVGDTDLVKEPGQCHPFILLENYFDEPLLLTKDKQHQLHCLSNVCTHRGTIVVNGPCRVTNLRCRYHGRLFQLDGRFLNMAEFKEVENFPSEEDNLKNLPLFQWGKWLFTSVENSILPEKYFGEMMQRLNWLPINEFEMRRDLCKDYMVDANWALYCENYLEGLHIPFVHAGLSAVIDFGNYSTELFHYSSLQLGIAKHEADCFDLPSSSQDYGKNVGAYYFWVFPNMMFNFYPWGLSVNIIEPVSINKTKVSFRSESVV